MGRLFLGSGVTMLALAACQPQPQAPTGPTRFEGVVQSDFGAFTSTSDRCAYSFTFDNLQVAWPPTAKPGPGETVRPAKRMATLALSPGARGKTVRLDIHGFYTLIGPAVPATANVTVAGERHPIQLPDGTTENGIYQRVEVKLPADAEMLPIVFEATMPRPTSPDTEEKVSIETLDLHLVDPPACVPPDDAKPAEPIANGQ